jgi:hypothetical protein
MKPYGFSKYYNVSEEIEEELFAHEQLERTRIAKTPTLGEWEYVEFWEPSGRDRHWAATRFWFRKKHVAQALDCMGAYFQFSEDWLTDTSVMGPTAIEEIEHLEYEERALCACGYTHPDDGEDWCPDCRAYMDERYYAVYPYEDEYKNRVTEGLASGDCEIFEYHGAVYLGWKRDD